MKYRDFTVQDIIIQPKNIKYRRGIWRTPDGDIIRAELPENINGHYGSELRRFILYQYYSLHITRPSILEYLLELEFKISIGEINSILLHDVPENLVIVSDEAGQFNIFIHALCWIHAERKINSLLPQSDEHNKILTEILDKFWIFYKKLKDFKKAPDASDKKEIEAEFDILFKIETSWSALNKALRLNLKNKQRLLRVLERPEIPLHNNLSENDIREVAKKRKISAGTRSDSGRECRDTFLSHKKTCRKLGISFWHYIYDRISPNKIKYLHYIKLSSKKLHNHLKIYHPLFDMLLFL